MTREDDSDGCRRDQRGKYTGGVWGPSERWIHLPHVRAWFSAMSDPLEECPDVLKSSWIACYENQGAKVAHVTKCYENWRSAQDVTKIEFS